MDSSRFDEFTKALASSISRRQALKSIAATVIGGIFGLGRASDVLADCQPFGHPCASNGDCCSGFCMDGRCFPRG